MELEALQSVAGEIEKTGASLVAVSPQLVRYSKQVAAELGLTFPVLSDKGNAVAAKFGLVFRMPEELRRVYLDFGIDLTRFNGDAAWTLPVPARFILDRGGRVRRAEAHPDYTVRPEPEALVEALNEIAGR